MSDRLKSAFDTIHAEDELKNSTKEYIAGKIRRNEKKRVFSCMRPAAAAAGILFLLLGSGGCLAYFTPVYAISVDVNPSIELGVNWFERVVSVEGYNEDGSRLAASLDIKYLEYTEALDRILEDENIKLYLSQDEIVSVTVVGNNDKKEEGLLKKVSSHMERHENVHCYMGNSEEVKSAHEEGFSFGKYRIYLELKKLDPDITAQEAQALSMCQIRDMIDELYDDEESEYIENDRNTSEHGSGHGKGGGHH